MFLEIIMKTSEKVSQILSTVNGQDLQKLQTLRVTCNSDSSFIACINKYKNFQKLLQKAFLLSRTWFGLGQSRTWKITIKSLKAAFQSIANGIKKLSDISKFPELIRKQIIKILDKTCFQMQLWNC